MGNPRSRSKCASGCGRGLALLVTLPLLISCAGPTSPSNSHDTGPPPAGMGGVTGIVVRGPVSPVVTGTSGSTVPVAGAKVIISTSGQGHAIKETSTDAEGRYQMFVSPGTYVVTLGPVDGILSTRDLPATVTVTEGQLTTVNVMLDTGVR